jgi:TonB-linked SusC/RagA family outer membrane protein
MRNHKLFFTILVSLCVFIATTAIAQELTISGTVTSKVSGDPLPGTNVVIKGTNFGTSTDENGEFRLTVQNMSQATLVFAFIGYKTQEVTVNASRDITVEMDEDVLKLSEVIVTGLATSVAKRNLANAVATVNADELIPAPTQTIERALSGKIAGISISQNTGAPGGGISVNLRGVSTIEGRTQPLYVVDGVIIDNAANQSGIDLVTKATGAGSAFPQGQPTNRIADLNPNDIETIEVLKGASASSIYGSKATNGVIIITTKQGRPGKTKIDVNQQFGVNSILNKIGTRRFTQATAEEVFGETGAQIFQQSGGQFIDYEDVLYGEEGFIAETSLNARGGNNNTQFFISGIFRDEDGIVKRTGYQKYGGRFNINHSISDRLKITANTNFLRTESDRGITGNDNTNTTFGFSLGFTPSFYSILPENGVYPDHQFNPSNPVHTRDLITNNELVNRTITSATLTWNVIKQQRHALDVIIQGGVDFYSQENKVVSPPELQFERNSDLPGSSLLAESESTNSNLYYNLVHNISTASNISFRTSVGLQFENRNRNYLLTQSRGLIVTQTNVDQAAAVNVFQTREIQRDRGFFVQEEIDLNEKIYLTAGLRGDASSANGDTEKYFLFPKFSGSIRLSEYDFWKGLSSFASEFKLRAAYGETGNLPPANAKFTSLIPSNIGGAAGLLPSTRRGNETIKPERTKELELGFDAALFDEKASLNFTYFRQNISDLILFPDLPPSSGFSDEVVNGGKMKTDGIEITLGVHPLRGNFRWSSLVNFYKTQSEITELTVDPFNKGGFATFLGTYRIQEGWSPTTIIGSERTVNTGTSSQTGDFVPLGDETPDFQIGFSNRFNIGGFELYFLLDWKQGGDIINLGKLITDLGGTSGDYDEVSTFMVENDNGVLEPKELKNGVGRLTVLGIQTAPYIEDGTYLKLREASINYSFPRKTVARWFSNQISYLRIGVSGRNLLMFTDYLGYDPEVSQFGNLAIGRSVDTIPYPSSRSFYFNIAFGL